MNELKIESEITVIIPFYNGKSFIKKALFSLANEITKADQIIIINDGSTRDEDVHFLKNLIKNFPIPIKLINKKNGGQSSARNLGAKLSKTRYISFLDQDDMVYPLKNKVLKKSLEEALIKDPLCCYTYGDVTRINEKDSIIENKFSSTRETLISNKKNSFNFETKKYIYKDLYRLVGSALFIRDKFLDSGGFDNNLVGYEDDDLFLNLHLSKYTFKKVTDEVLFWRLNRFSTSYTDTFKKSRFNYFKKLVKIFKNKDLQFIELILSRFISRFFIDIFIPIFKIFYFKGNLFRSTKASLDILKESKTLIIEITKKLSKKKYNIFSFYFRVLILNKLLYFLKLSKFVL